MPAPPTLPCLTIERSPANDARVILDALAATPLLRLLAGEGDAWWGEHRAELRALLQHVSSRLSGTIEATADRLASPVAADARAAPPLGADQVTDAETVTPPPPSHRSAWDGGSFLR